MRIPFFSSDPAPVRCTTILESCVNGYCKKYTIDQLDNDKVMVHADIGGRRKVVTLSSSEGKKVSDYLKSLDVSGSPFFTFKPIPPMLYPNTLEGISECRRKLDRHEEELKRYERDREQQPNKRQYYLEQRTALLRFLDDKFIGRSVPIVNPPAKPVAPAPTAAPAA